MENSEELEKTAGSWPFQLDNYDCNHQLYKAEVDALNTWHSTDYNPNSRYHKNRPAELCLSRITTPIYDALSQSGYLDKGARFNEIYRYFFNELHTRQSMYWSWDEAVWIEVICYNYEELRIRFPKVAFYRHLLITCAYLFGHTKICFKITDYRQHLLAKHIFGKINLEKSINSILDESLRLGQGSHSISRDFTTLISEALLANNSPYIADLKLPIIEEIHQKYLTSKNLRRKCIALSRTLHNLNIINKSIKLKGKSHRERVGINDTVPTEWMDWLNRWYDLSTSAPSTRNGKRVSLAKVGRWLAEKYPQVTRPDQWTRDIAFEFVAAVNNMNTGEWTHPGSQEFRNDSYRGKPLKPNAKACLLSATRVFFADCIEYGWIRATFDPYRCLRTPRSINSLRGPAPRIIEDDIWAKLLNAGLNITEDDLTLNAKRWISKNADGTVESFSFWYPIEMVRAIVLVWLFAALRADEIRRLRVGCSRWQLPINASKESPNSEKQVCLLTVPNNKTSKEFVKPVDYVVGEAIATWEDKRPNSVTQPDIKSGELVNYLFEWRGKQIGKSYLNLSLIPLLCKKAGIPESDARGKISSHRARSTIATQLLNAREAMTIFQMKEWLGHKSISSTLHYAGIKPTVLAQAYSDAEFFGRNTRLIKVLVDQDAIKSGAAANGEAWRYFDLGHGFCTYDTFAKCKHRMACAKCSFYEPKPSSYIQLLEAKGNLLHMQQSIPLLPVERAAVDEGIEALNKLVISLQDVNTPQGPTPRELQQYTEVSPVKTDAV